MKIGRVVLAMAISAGVASADEKKPDVAAARVAAEENAKTPAGRRYETALEASPNPDALKMAFKGIRVAQPGIL